MRQLSLSGPVSPIQNLLLIFCQGSHDLHNRFLVEYVKSNRPELAKHLCEGHGFNTAFTENNESS